MKKIRQNSKKGFTLVELIVVLVILAVMAAMLVPALTGYIDEARREKDYQAAATVLTAAQSIQAKVYAGEASSVEQSEVERLSGVTIASFSCSDDGYGKIQTMSVQFEDDGATYTYTLGGDPMWTVTE
jgi:prepilin-type N-terminal cleavage/methylation domain-containing protein